MSLSILFVLFGSALGYGAAISETMGCVEARTAARYRQQFQLKSGGFGAWNLCDESNLNKKVLTALRTLEEGEFAGDRAGPLGLTVTAESDYEYFRNRIRHLRRNGCSDESAVACVRNGERTMKVHDVFFELPAVNRVGTLLHEARHVDGFPHTDCTDGPLAGAGGGCDLNFAYRGSYAVELAYYARVALAGKNFHPAYKALARSSAVLLMEQNFVQAPAASKERLGLVDARDSHLVIFDGERFQERRATVANDAKLVARNYGIAVLPRDRRENTWLVDPYTSEPLPPETLESQLGSTFRSYNKLTPAERPLILDVLNRRDLQARLHPDRLEVMMHPEAGDFEPRVVTLPTAGLGILGFAADNLCWRPDPIFGRPKILPVQVLAEGGRIYQAKDLRSFEAEPSLAPLACELSPELRSTVEFRGKFLGLLRSGEVVEIGRDGGPAKPYAPLAGLRAKELITFSMYAELNDGVE